MPSARTLSDHLAALLSAEHAAMADFLVALADFDRRRLWVDLGHGSLFYYLHRELGLSKGAAYHRKVAAELLQRFPEVEAPLRDGRLCITSVVELARVITPENRAEVLPRFFHRSKREAKAVAAEIQPAEIVTRRDVVTRVVAASQARPEPTLADREAAIQGGGVGAAFHVAAGGEPAGRTTGNEGVVSAQLVHPDEPGSARLAQVVPTGVNAVAGQVRPRLSQSPDTAEPLTSDLRRLHVTVSRRFLDKLESARDGLSHAAPGATSEQVLEAALDLLLERQAKRRGLVQRPRAPKPAHADGNGRAADGARASAAVPAQVRREVWRRDRGCCQWPLEAGGVCGAKVRLELDHIIPKARGGPSTVANRRLLCRFHNLVAARQVFGGAWMDRFALGP